MEIQSFLGTGWSFPPSFDKVGRTAIMVSDIADIEESIRIILSTIPGERLMQPTFGCDLNKLVFENFASSLMGEMKHMIYYALLNYEPRVKDVNIELLSRDELKGILHIQLNYTVIITNTRHNLVYPFYFLEGTSLT
ncbi:GPW/gp25 family protein [Chitinophaga sancti]|uniref:GPW/gp25 family protein n=1 Tax=Chitinophaga sancti TaxID=1004 RepID=UPI002A7602A7|nr:GPW/gp25 family protein [Chitinophaga sancti]WPQ60889.1 GPW/gp25 family protein [Chitinophaga sancti]